VGADECAFHFYGFVTSTLVRGADRWKLTSLGEAAVAAWRGAGR
jgi:hypothetical protein